MQIGLMESVADRLKIARENAGFESVADAARALGVSYPTYAGHENGSRGLRRDAVTKYARRFKVSADWLLTGHGGQPAADTGHQITVDHLPILGSARAGAFLDISILDQSDEPETIPVVPDTRYARARQYALRIDGDSMDRVFREGECAICASWPETGFMHPEDGQCLHVERMRGELVEVTIKRFRIRDGRKWLDPESSNPAHKPIEINGDEATEIFVKGLVIGVWRAI